MLGDRSPRGGERLNLAGGSFNDSSALNWGVAKKAGRRRQFQEKIVDETIILKRPRRGAKLREEVWQTADGEVTKYNLAYINHLVCQVDNGRVLGYDNSHDCHHRHFMGRVEPFEFTGYRPLVKRFQEEVRELWKREVGRQEDEQNS